MKNLTIFVIGVLAVFMVQQIEQTTAAVSCIECDSSKDANCIADLSKFTPKPDCDKCFTKKDASGTITRGCMAEADPCEESNGCVPCKSSNCNNQKICKKCDSTSDPDCAQLVNNKATDNTICAADTTKCFINIKADKQTERGCATAEIEKSCDSATCKMCEAPNCNTEIFPARKTCYQCSGSNCNEVNDGLAKVCQLYDADMKCYTIGTSATTMERGCNTDANAKCTKAEDANCLLCDSDKCNNRQYERPQALKCEQCNSSQDKACQNAQNTEASKLTNCEKPLKYNEEEMCRTQTSKDVTYRGCFYDLVQLGECNESTKCKTCTAEGCNKEAMEPSGFTCIRCRSDREPKCWNEANTLAGESCIAGEGSQDGCFTGVWNGVAIRGCIIDLDEQPKHTCLDKENKQCTQCVTSKCNTEKAGAAAIQLMTSLLCIALFAVFKLF